MHIAQYDVDRSHADALRQLIEVHHAHIGREWDVDLAAYARHGFVAPARIFVVLDVERLDKLAKAYGCRRREDCVRVVSQLLVWKCLAQRPQGVELLLRSQHSALELDRRKIVLRLEGFCVGHNFVCVGHAPESIWVGMPIKDVSGERHLLAQAAAKQITQRHASHLPLDIP